MTDDGEPHPYHPSVQPPNTRLLDPAQIPRLVERCTANTLANDAETRPTLFTSAHPDALNDDGAHKALLLDARKQLRRVRAAEDFSDIRESVEEHLAWERAWLPAASANFATLLKTMADAQLAVIEEELRRIEGEVGETLDLIPLVDENDTWEAALNCWKEARQPSPKTVNDVITQIQRFKAHIGDLPLPALTPEHIDQFKSLCLREDKLEHGRVNVILSLLSPLVNHAIRRKLTRLVSNPIKGMKYPAKVVSRSTVRPCAPPSRLTS